MYIVHLIFHRLKTSPTLEQGGLGSEHSSMSLVQAGPLSPALQPSSQMHV